MNTSNTFNTHTTSKYLHGAILRMNAKNGIVNENHQYLYILTDVSPGLRALKLYKTLLKIGMHYSSFTINGQLQLNLL